MQDKEAHPMKIRNMLGLAAIGGFLYAHKKRGGTMSLDSFKETAQSLWSDLQSRAREIRDEAEDKLETAKEKAQEVFDQKTGYSAGYNYETRR
jgi:hypothetical protein